MPEGAMDGQSNWQPNFADARPNATAQDTRNSYTGGFGGVAPQAAQNTRDAWSQLGGGAESGSGMGQFMGGRSPQAPQAAPMTQFANIGASLNTTPNQQQTGQVGGLFGGVLGGRAPANQFMPQQNTSIGVAPTTGGEVRPQSGGNNIATTMPISQPSGGGNVAGFPQLRSLLGNTGTSNKGQQPQ